MGVFFDQWFGVHADLVNGGHLVKISHSAVRLYLVLCWKQDITNSRQFKLTDAEIRRRGHVSTRSLSAARKELRGAGIVRYERAKGGVYTYTLCDVKTGVPYPGEPTSKPERKPKREKQGWAKGPSFTPQFSRTESISLESDDPTSFDFGFNARTPPSLDTSSFSPFRTRKVC